MKRPTRRGSSSTRKMRTKRASLSQRTVSKNLRKHPYYSSKIIAPLIYLEKPGTGIFLIRERAKLYKGTGERKKHSLSKKLSYQAPLQRHEEEKSQAADKRMKGNDGKPIMAGASQSLD